MTQLVFFEKPGCATNSRQKLMLQRAGVPFSVRSLLAEQWTPSRLEEFFSRLPVVQWFNRAAPRVKSGEVKPDMLSAEQALALMVADPLLIRRPLLQKGDWHYVGFVWDDVAPALGISVATDVAAIELNAADMEACSHGKHAHAASCAASTEVAS